jgi:hypothetical protein
MNTFVFILFFTCLNAQTVDWVLRHGNDTANLNNRITTYVPSGGYYDGFIGAR